MFNHFILHQFIRPSDQAMIQLWEDLEPTMGISNGVDLNEPYAQFMAPVATPVKMDNGDVIQLQVKIPLGPKMPISTARRPVVVEDAFAQFDRIKTDKPALMPYVTTEMKRITKMMVEQQSVIARPR